MARYEPIRLKAEYDERQRMVVSEWIMAYPSAWIKDVKLLAADGAVLVDQPNRRQANRFLSHHSVAVEFDVKRPDVVKDRGPFTVILTPGMEVKPDAVG